MHHFVNIFWFGYRENEFTATHPGVQMIQHSSQNIYALNFVCEFFIFTV